MCQYKHPESYLVRTTEPKRREKYFITALLRHNVRHLDSESSQRPTPTQAISPLQPKLHRVLVVAILLLTAPTPRLFLSLGDVDSARPRLRFSPRSVDDSSLDVACQTEKCLLYVDVALGRDFHKRNAQLIRERLALLRRHGTLLLPITLVANQDLVHPFCRMLLDV